MRNKTPSYDGKGLFGARGLTEKEPKLAQRHVGVPANDDVVQNVDFEEVASPDEAARNLHVGPDGVGSPLIPHAA